jgi:hypothetical protein
LLKPHFESQKFKQRFPTQPPPIEVTTEGEQKWEVEKILKKRKFRNRIEYLVSWKNYPSHESTWEPEWKLMEDVPKLIKEFNSKNFHNLRSWKRKN